MFSNVRFQAHAAVLAVILFVGGAAAANAASEAGTLQLLGNPVASDPTLAKFIGNWRGDGTARESARAPNEKVSCRLANGWTADRRLLRMQLTCFGVDYRFSANGFIGKSGGNYRGTVSSSSVGSALAAGKGSGGGLSLTLTPTSGREPPAAMSIRVAGNRITNTLTRRDPTTGTRYRALNITLRR